MRTVQRGPVVGLLAELALLATLAGTVGLGAVAAVVGTAVGLVLNGALSVGLTRSGAGALGPANRVTLTRATLVGGISALIADGFDRPSQLGVLVALTAVALALDAVDGRVARRTSSVTALGARFDMEVDAFLILVLSIAVSRSFGVWVLAIGAARYALFAAGLLLPWLTRPVPPRYWRKVVAAVQGIVLTVAVAGVLPRTLTAPAVVAALALLGESFGRDVWWLRRQHIADRARTRRSAPRRSSARSVPAGRAA